MMKKKLSLVLIMVLVLSLALVGCGKRDQEAVVSDLTNFKQELTSYESKATMTVTANNTTQKYTIDTWYMAPNFYRIALGNDKNEVTQVIVRNDEGIYVVSPQLKKSFRFKGDWAENQGHVYLYHAALDRILKSVDREYENKDGSVVFTMKMEPENPLVSKQRITLADSNLHPQQIALLDKDMNSVVSVDYTSFKAGVEFKKDQFTPEAAMTLAPQEAKPVMAGSKDFGIIEPHYVPQGTEMAAPQETRTSVMLRFTGEKPFTITEERPKAGEGRLASGEIVDLWGTTAVVSGSEGSEIKSMHWFHNGVQFSLTGHLAVEEMVKVAQSMIGMGGK